MSYRSTITSRRNSFIQTLGTGLTLLDDLPSLSTSARKTRRLKTVPNRQLQIQLQTKRQQCKEIKKQMKKERQVQLLDFIRKSLKYQELLDINDNKKKRLPTLNSKVGEVKKVIVSAELNRHQTFTLSSQLLQLHHQSSPPPRQGHTAAIHHKNIIVLGGHCSAPHAFGHIYSPASNTWIKQFTLPSARSYHSTVLYKNKYAIIFGGMGAYDISRRCRVCYNSVDLIDLHNYHSQHMKMKDQETIEGRRLHGCVLIGKYMLVLGGVNTKREVLGDLCYLDLKQLRWYKKEYGIQSEDLKRNMEKGVMGVKGVSCFKNRRTLPLYSSEYKDTEGVYFFGGVFGNELQNTVFFMGFNSYIPCIRKVLYSGTPPAGCNMMAEKIDENLIILVSGEVDNRGVKIYKIRESEFVGVYKFSTSPMLGGVGSTLTKGDEGMYVIFGMAQGGYSPDIVLLKLQERYELQREVKKVGRKVPSKWKIWDSSLDDSSSF